MCEKLWTLPRTPGHRAILTSMDMVPKPSLLFIGPCPDVEFAAIISSCRGPRSGSLAGAKIVPPKRRVSCHSPPRSLGPGSASFSGAELRLNVAPKCGIFDRFRCLFGGRLFHAIRLCGPWVKLPLKSAAIFAHHFAADRHLFYRLLLFVWRLLRRIKF